MSHINSSKQKSNVAGLMRAHSCWVAVSVVGRERDCGEGGWKKAAPSLFSAPLPLFSQLALFLLSSLWLWHFSKHETIKINEPRLIVIHGRGRDGWAGPQERMITTVLARWQMRWDCARKPYFFFLSLCIPTLLGYHSNHQRRHIALTIIIISTYITIIIGITAPLSSLAPPYAVCQLDGWKPNVRSENETA